MRVVSQNRSFSFDFDRTIFWRQYGVIYAKVGNESILIGNYKTEERAAEVFDDMHMAYYRDASAYMTEDFSLPFDPKLERRVNTVYYMPEA